MTGPNFDHLARQHTLGGLAVPGIVHALGGEGEPELVWRNELGGLTFRLGDRFLKWNPASSGIDLERELGRLRWISARHPAPKPVDYGVDGDGQWLVTEALPGDSAVGDTWRGRGARAIRGRAPGLAGMPA